MNTMECNRIVELLGIWMEGEPQPAVQDHLGQCGECRALAADLQIIRAAAPSLAEESEPPARVWLAIRARLEAEGLIRERPLGFAERLRAIFPLVPHPVMAGAYALVIVTGVLLLSSQSRNMSTAMWLDRTQATSAALDSQFADVEQGTVAALQDPNPDVTASLNNNLALVDNYITMCEKNVQEEPQSELARDYLYQAYQQKAELLAAMTERGVGGQ